MDRAGLLRPLLNGETPDAVEAHFARRLDLLRFLRDQAVAELAGDRRTLFIGLVDMNLDRSDAMHGERRIADRLRPP